MAGNRGQEIEAFYWLLIRVAIMVFGYLMMVGGGLMALGFAAEKLRTGTVAYGGQEHADLSMALRLVVIPGLVAVAGFFAVRRVRGWKAKSSTS